MNELDVTISVIPTDNDFQIIDIYMCRGRILPRVIRSLRPPTDIDANKGIVINGRAPIWLYAYLAAFYQHAPWVATFSPTDGATIVVSRKDSERQVGDVIPTQVVLPHIPRHPEGPTRSSPKTENHSKVVALLGPPHSGKSVLLNAIRLKMQKELSPICFQQSFYVLRACPDGEGDWFSEIPEEIALTLRYKNRFDEEFVNRICGALQELRPQKKLLLVDCGGKLDRKNQRILNLCTHAIIVSRDPEQILLWRGAALLSELAIVAEVESTLNACTKVMCSSPLRIRLGKLERGNERTLELPRELLDLLRTWTAE